MSNTELSSEWREFGVEVGGTEDSGLKKLPINEIDQLAVRYDNAIFMRKTVENAIRNVKRDMLAKALPSKDVQEVLLVGEKSQIRLHRKRNYRWIDYDGVSADDFLTGLDKEDSEDVEAAMSFSSLIRVSIDEEKYDALPEDVKEKISKHLSSQFGEWSVSLEKLK